MSKVLFLMHGMGVHGTDWARAVTAKLDEVAARYREFQEDRPALSARVKLVPIGYDSAFADLLAQWSKSAAALREHVDRNGIDVGTLTDWLRDASSTESNFFWSHVVDVLLYRFFDVKKNEVRTRVLNQIVSTLRAEQAGGNIVEASVLAHSLGTSVAHDCLSFLGTHPIGGSEAFMARNFRFSNVFMLANVGRVLETSPRVYESCLRPASANPDQFYCDRYYNFRHAFDPIPAVRCFKPENWGADYRPCDDISHFRDLNVHDYLHYLDHPAVHVPIIRGLLGPVIDNAELQAALDAYRDVVLPPRCEAALAALREELRQHIAQFENSDDPQEFIIAGAKALAAIKEAADACA